MPAYNYIDLFHGIGGFALGAHMAGMRFNQHFCSDIDPFPQQLYGMRFPDSVQLGDIRQIDTKELKNYGRKWIITGGFPCQDISIAGKGAGITGERSGLWFEYWRLIRDLRPRFAIMENVGALTFRGLDTVLGSLAEIGYHAEWQNIRAEDVGAPHKRERIWIVAYPDRYTDSSNRREKGKKGFVQEINRPSGYAWLPGGTSSGSGILAHTESGESGEQTQRKGRQGSCGGSKKVSHTLCAGFQEAGAEQQTARTPGGHQKVSHTSGLGCDERTVFRGEIQEEIEGTEFNFRDIASSKGRIDKLKQPNSQTAKQRKIPNHYSQRFQEQYHGESAGPGYTYGSHAGGEIFHPGWATEPQLGRLAHGVPNRVDRLKGLGNAIVPQIACLLFQQIKPYL